MATESDSTAHYFTSNETLFKCDICVLTFRTSSERNAHILDHFRRTTCSICHQTLVQLGDIWYSSHEHPNHNDIKTEFDPDEVNECLTEPVVFSNSGRDHLGLLNTKIEVDPIENLCNEPNAVENVFGASSEGLTSIENAKISQHDFTLQSIDIPSYIEHKPVDIMSDPIDAENSLHANEATTKSKKPQKRKCDICDKEFCNAGDLKYHKNIHLGLKPFECEICGRAWADKRNLHKHRRCNQKCTNTKRLNTTTEPSTATSTQNNWQCEICKVDFSFEANLIEHKNVYHPERADIPNESPNEGILESNTDLGDMDTAPVNEKQPDATVDKEERGYIAICGICDKKFACRSGLKYHLNLHLGVKPFECDICGKCWSDKRNLTAHKKRHKHNEDSPGGTDTSSMKNIGSGSDAKSINENQSDAALQEEGEGVADRSKKIKTKIGGTCEVCNKKFIDRKSVIYHRNLHAGLRPFKCDVCDRSFTCKGNLTAHIKTHAKDKKVADLVNSGELNIRNYEDIPVKKIVSSVDWVCEYCNDDFELEMGLVKHISKEHNEDRQQQCNICAEKFNSLHHLLVHIRAHPESTQHECTYDGCGQRFAYKAILGTHLNKHNRINGPIIRKTQDDITETTLQHADGIREESSVSGNPFTCPICSKVLANRTNVLQHIESTHKNANERIKCTVAECEKIFKSTEGLIHHIKIHHPKAIKKCELCPKRSFYSEAKLAEHQLKHAGSEKGPFACSICPRTFRVKHFLRSHITSHEKEATCNICNVKFSSAKTMLEHRERHGKKPVITCRVNNCNQVFEDRREFMLHASQHPDSEKKKSMCPHCGKTMGRSYLQDHINTHTGSKPHECSHCKKRFAKSGSLRRHLLIHSGKKPYVCDIEGCEKAYRDSIDLKRHKFSVHKIYTKKHICSICSKVFSERKLLTKHTTNVHNKVDAIETLP